MGRPGLIEKSFLAATILAVALTALGCQGDRGQVFVTAAPAGQWESTGTFAQDSGLQAEELALAEVGKEVVRESEVLDVVEVEAELAESEAMSKVAASPDEAGAGPAVAPDSVDRVIVRRVDASLVVEDISGAIESLGGLASSLGGWVIDSSRDSGNFGFVSFRVPADRLDEAMASVRDLAVSVEAENGSSRDVTDQYVDLKARLNNQLATERALLDLLGRAETVEEALNVQRELSVAREQVERLQGQITLIEQTSAYSLVSVTLRRAPMQMSVDAGDDIAGAVGQPVRFRASFRPPEGVDDFRVVWDFGDGSDPVRIHRTAPTQDAAVRVTATVTHRYGDDQDSPYIAEVTIEGSGDEVLVEGGDVLTVSIFRLPRIEVFAGEPQVVEAGDTVKFSGSFTRPTEVKDVTFAWEFGDGSEPVRGTLESGVTAALAEHSYRDHRPAPYRATLTVRGDSEAGAVESSGVVLIKVDEAPGWTLGGWSAGDTWRSIIRALSGVGQVLLTILFWLVILSPVWLAAIAVYVWRRRRASKLP